MSTEVVATAAAPSYPEATPVPLSVDRSGNLRVSGSFTTTPSGTQNVNETQVGGVAILTGAGATGTGSERVTVAQDSTTVAGSSSLPAGTNVIGHVIVDSGTEVVTGNVASGGTDSGNPVKIGGVYNSTQPTFTTGQRGDVQLDARGNVRIAINNPNTLAVATVSSFGDAASNGNVGLFTNSNNSVFNGTTWDRARSGGVLGMTGVSNQASPSGGYSYNHIATATTTTVKSGVGTLHSITVNSLGTVASTLTVYDSTTGSGTIIAIINSLSITGTLTFDVAFATGLTIVSTGTVAPDVTVSYK